MAIGRSRYAPPYVSTKGHSVLKQRSYATRTPPAPSVSRTSGAAYDSRSEEFLLADRVSDVNYLSNSLMDQGYDTAQRSRGRDQQLLREATKAIVSSESYATPQTSVASRRVARGQSLVPRAASVPPRPLRTEVDTSSSTTAVTWAPAPAPYSPPPRAKRPIVVLPPKGPQGRATSVPPVVLFREAEGRAQNKVPVVPRFTREELRGAARARSVPPAVVAPSSARRGKYRSFEKRLVDPVQAAPREPLPTAGLRAHKVPRRFLTRTPMRTGFTSLQGYAAEEGPGKGGIKNSVTRARVMASSPRFSSPRSKGVSSSFLPYSAPLPRPKPAPLGESLKDFPRVFVPARGGKPSNRSKAAIIASKLEPDPLKRRRPRSEFAANKYRELRKEALDNLSVGSGQSGSSGQHGSSDRRRR